MRQTILLVDDDRRLTEAFAVALEQPGRTLVVCSDIESAELAIERFPVTHVVSDVQFSGPFGFEGLPFVRRIRAKVPHCTIVLMTGGRAEGLRESGLAAGAAAVLGKPFDLAQLEALIGPPPAADPFELRHVWSIDEILEGGMLDVVFQPIVSVERCETPFGFEALLRVRGGWPVGGPCELLDYAERRSLAVELNRAALVRAIESAGVLDPASLLFLNVDPQTFHDARLVSDVLEAAARARVAPDRIVLEITERAALIDDAVTAQVLDALRAHGVRFALDDHGSAHSHLGSIDRILPSFLKIGHAFGTNLEHDPGKQRVVRHFTALAHDLGCKVVLEGIEGAATLATASSLGIELAQGYFFSHPREAAYWAAA